ncbi:MAG: 2 protein [Patescibacteria group bacterium]|jgi:membrane-bound lytic murein transglycosylase B|nr:2 protein [Patescibacteria group bacterium]
MLSQTLTKNKNFITKGVIAFAIVLFVFSVFGPSFANAQLSPEERARLETELAQLEKEIKEQETILAGQKNKSASLQRDIELLRARIDASKKKIAQKDIQIKKIGSEIKNKNQTIEQLNGDIEDGKQSLAQLIKKTHEMDYMTFAHAILSSESISDFYGDIDSYASLKKSVQDSVNEIRGVKVETETVKKQLEEKQVEEIDAKKAIEQEKSKVESSEKDQRQLLSISKNQEAEYAKVLADRQAKAAGIRARLFELRGQGAIPFGEAYEYAKVASKATGVRPAFILAILKQESNLGANVGTCNRPGDTRTWREIMPGPNSGSWRDDHAAFLRITKKLGLSPDGQPLSCPLAIGGWGGAMGPSQFIPTTWESYENRIAAAVGASVANPWNPAHAITATALYVRDLGAAAQTYTAEREAACKYYSGRGCSDPKVKNAFYGNAVMSHAANIQKDIDVLESF